MRDGGRHEYSENGWGCKVVDSTQWMKNIRMVTQQRGKWRRDRVIKAGWSAIHEGGEKTRNGSGG